MFYINLVIFYNTYVMYATHKLKKQYHYFYLYN